MSVWQESQQLALVREPDPVDGQVSGRERVLEQAAHLFVRQGYQDTTLRDIAAAAGMKAGSIYYHFDSKEQLLASVLDTGIELITKAFLETAAALGPDAAPRDRLHRHVLAHLEALSQHGPFTTSHVTVFHTAPAAVQVLAIPSRDAYEVLWADLLEGLAAAGDLRGDIDLGLHRILLLGAANSTLAWFHLDGARRLEELADALTTQFWTGVAADAKPTVPDPPDAVTDRTTASPPAGRGAQP